jgi:CDP-diacylglycerol---glycerol-3-phosphate 3-phosphatidyltransferase
MNSLWQSVIKGYLRVIEPVAALLIRLRVSPNLLTTVGTLCSIAGGLAFAGGRIRLAGWIIALTAIFDVLDGTVARRTQQSTIFGAFYDSSLDRIADGAVLGGILYFFATSRQYSHGPMVAVSLLGIIGTFLVSYTRARAEALGIDAKVGFMQRPERVVLISVPQLFFGLAWHGAILMAVVGILALSSWATAVQRVLYVRRATHSPAPASIRVINEKKKLSARFASRRAQS